jgi:hypothetical protein
VARPIGRGRFVVGVMMVFGMRIILFRFHFVCGLVFIMNCMARLVGRGHCVIGWIVGRGLFFEAKRWVCIGMLFKCLIFMIMNACEC